MSKKTRGKQKPRRPAGRSDASDPLQQGLRAFQAGRFAEAIDWWTPLAASHEKVATALAQAHFRLALQPQAPASQEAHLQAAMQLLPDNLRFPYQLGLLLHGQNDLPRAIQWYRTVLARDPAWPHAGLMLALAELEHTRTVDLTTLPGTTPAIQAEWAPVQQLLCNRPLDLAGDDPRERFWRGLAAIHEGDGSAAADLADRRALPSAMAIAIRRYYAGVAAAQQGDFQTALQAWQYGESRRFNPLWYRTNTIAALQRYLRVDQADESLNHMADIALQTLDLAADNVGLAEKAVQILDQAAHAAALDASWERAIAWWEGARQLVTARSGLGSPRPLYHNLALAYEAQEEWAAAAETWRSMLRTRPRVTVQEASAPPLPGEMSAAHWAWVRERVITCYTRAGMPGEAVSIFRQTLKIDPNDFEIRLQLVEALLGNDQEQAAINELNYILKLDPKHTEAQLQRASIHLARNEVVAAEKQVRAVLKQEPDSEPARRLLSRILLIGGNNWLNIGRYPEARRCLSEGQQLDPQNYEFPLNLARVAIDMQDLEQARPLLAQTLELGATNPQAYLMVIHCWVHVDAIDEARAVVERARTALAVTGDFYVMLALIMLREILPPPEPLFFNVNVAPPPPFTTPALTPLTRLMIDVLDLAVAIQPNDPEIYYYIADSFVADRPDIALPYAERAVQLTPEDPQALITLGLAMGLLNQIKEAKKMLRRASSQARILGEPELMRKAEQLARQIGTPALRMSLLMARFADELEIDFDDPRF